MPTVARQAWHLPLGSTSKASSSSSQALLYQFSSSSPPASSAALPCPAVNAPWPRPLCFHDTNYRKQLTIAPPRKPRRAATLACSVDTRSPVDPESGTISHRRTQLQRPLATAATPLPSPPSLVNLLHGSLACLSSLVDNLDSILLLAHPVPILPPRSESTAGFAPLCNCCFPLRSSSPNRPRSRASLLSFETFTRLKTAPVDTRSHISKSPILGATGPPATHSRCLHSAEDRRPSSASWCCCAYLCVLLARCFPVCERVGDRETNDQ
jgi:hypothetical protein